MNNKEIATVYLVNQYKRKYTGDKINQAPHIDLYVLANRAKVERQLSKLKSSVNEKTFIDTVNDFYLD